jgi:hypothetical protein
VGGLIAVAGGLMAYGVNFPDLYRRAATFVGAREQRRGDRETERVGGLEVDNRFKPSRPLDRQVSRFGAFQNLE